MCGIAGIAGYTENPVKNIENMNRQMIKRGPDTGDYWLNETDKIVLGHRRLSIIDLSENGSQPMESSGGRYVIVYNGEIYNAPEIKKKLEQKVINLKLRGTSDTEILLNAIEQYGLNETLKICRGMFALAVYDRQEKTLQLARDRMGEKPLYYGQVNGSFVFASDINSIRAIEDFHNPIEKKVLGIYFRHGYIPAPYSIYEGIYKLEPGKILTVNFPFTTWNHENYFDITEIASEGQKNIFSGTQKEAVDELEKLLKNAISGQMLSDVPLGAFLSGGIDSTLIVSLMQSISKNKVKSFTVGFEEKKYDEAVYARETAKLLGTDHTEMYVGYRDVMDLLPIIPKAFGEPFADSSQLPTMLVSKMTKEHVTVSLSGDAGDEFFCGYNSYKDVRHGLAVLQGKLPILREPFRTQTGKILLKFGNEHSPYLRTAGRCFTIKTPEDYYRSMLDDDNRVNRLVKEKTIFTTNNNSYPDGLLQDPESNLMLMDMKQYLPDDILTKVDRAGMYYSLETRIPLLDADVIRFAWTLPLSYKMEDGITKKTLRELLYRYVPKEMMDRPKKGFSVPVSKWLKDGMMREWAENVMKDCAPMAEEFIDTSVVESIWMDYIKNDKWSSLIWYILMFEQWLLQI